MMKKIVLCLAMLLLSAAPVSAAVTLSATVDCNDVTISYVNSEPNHVRAFAIDIVVVSSDANIIDVCDIYADYNIHPGSFVDGGVDADDNNAVADDSYQGTLEGYNTMGMTIEMGSLYVGDANAPEDTCDLLTFTVDGQCTIDVCENVIRGGIVMEDPDASSNLDLSGVQGISVDGTGCAGGSCYTGPDAAEWAAVGSPDSWCNPRQCHGDADGILNTYGRGGGTSAWVAFPDVQILVNGYQVTGYSDPVTHPWIAADFDHVLNTYGRGGGTSARVAFPDVQILVNYYQVTTPPLADCLDASPSSP